MKNKVVVIGGGLMGGGIACMSALAGHPTAIVDIRDEFAKNAVEHAKTHADELVANELTTQAQRDAMDALMTGTADRDAALSDAGLVIEAIVENLEKKQALFCEIEKHVAEDTPILSNTSGLRITDIAAGMAHPERALTAHFWFPAYLVPLVEVVMSDKSLLSVAESVRDLLKTWGKAPVIVRRDLPGQLANRVLQAILRETIDIVQSGLATAEDVDMAIKMGIGVRLPAWGPLEHADAVGMELIEKVQTTVLPDLARNTTAAPILREMLDKNELGYKTGKGFYDWGTKSMDRLVALRNDTIIAAVKLMRKHDAQSR